MTFYSLKDKSDELLANLKAEFLCDAHIFIISSADLYNTDDALEYEFKVVQAGYSAYVGGIGYSIINGNDRFKKIIKNWCNKHMPSNQAK